MGLLNIIYRTITKTSHVTKGSELTWTELDTNISELEDAIVLLQTTGNIAPYQPGPFIYTPDPTASQYVSYSGNTYLFVSPAPATNVTPGTNPAIWELVSNGALAHVRNTDDYLAYGTPNQVSAIELKALTRGIYVVAARSVVQAAITAGSLKPGYLYVIADSVVPVIMRAIAATELDRKGFGIFKNADYQLTKPGNLGPYSTSLTPAINNFCIANDIHYKSTTGVNPGIPPAGDPTNWSVLARTDSSYVQEVDPVIYDIATNKILLRDDKRGNLIGWDDATGTIATYDPVPKFQFGNDNVRNNKIRSGYLECLGNTGTIKGNTVEDESCLLFSANKGEISLNLFRKKAGNTVVLNIGMDAGKKFNRNEIAYDFPFGAYSDIDYEEMFVDKSNSTFISKPYDLTTGYMVGNTFQYPGEQINGILVMTGGTTFIIDGFFARPKHDFWVYPDASMTSLTIKHNGAGIGSPDPQYQFLNGGADVVLNGAKGDAILLGSDPFGNLIEKARKKS